MNTRVALTYPGRDLWLAAVLAIVPLAGWLLDAPPLLRLIPGVLAVLVVPGYGVFALIVPLRERFAPPVILASSIGISLALLAILGPLVDQLPGGLAPVNLLSALAIVSVASLVGARLRRHGLVMSRGGSPIILLLLMPVVLALAGAGWLATRLPAPTTSFAVLGDGGLTGYPQQLRPGSAAHIAVEIRNSAPDERLRIEARADGILIGTLEPPAIASGAVWRGELRFVTPATPGDRRIDLLLVEHDTAAPRRTLWIWVEVTP